MTASPWTLDQHVAQLTLGPLRALIDLRDPAGGLQELHLDGSPLRAHLLGVLLARQVDTTPADVYVRGEDLVATYPQSLDRAMRVQVYWRCHAHPSLSVELQVSVQTDELGIATPVVAFSQVETVEVQRLSSVSSAAFSAMSITPGSLDQLTPHEGPGCLVFHPPSSDWCYAEMIHSADFQQDQLGMHESASGGRRATLEHRLFPGTLEKGVIVRARIRGLFLRQHTAARDTAADYQQFLRAPLPLTT